MRERIETLGETADEPAAAARELLWLRLMIALGDNDGFLRAFASARRLTEPWRARRTRLAARLSSEPVPDLQAPKVFGIGLSKTGTTSLVAALETLGYLAAHYANPFSSTLLTDADFLTFDAAGDTPVCHRLEALFHTFPNARFVLTVRDFDSWLPSFEGQLRRTFKTADFGEIIRRGGLNGEAVGGRELAAVRADLYLNHPDARAAYDAYQRRVDDLFVGERRERLLRLDLFAGEGWRELCGFLGRPEPATPFPWENRSGRESHGNAGALG